MNPLFAWLAENFTRLFAKSPTFYKIWNWVSGALIALSGLPMALTQLGITLPAPYDFFASKAVFWASIGVLFMSLTSVQSKTVGVDENGVPLKQTDTTKLPFTTKVENKALDKAPDLKILTEDKPVTGGL